MSTGLIIAVLVIVAAVIVLAAVLAPRARNRTGGKNLKQRFGPEYDRTVARHDGDTKAAERELAGRVERHGDLRRRPLEATERERFEARWAAVQEHFVDSPHEAVTEADGLLADLAGALGFPDGGQYEEQLAALSVHHGHHVHGYRRVHRAAYAAPADGRDGSGNTEELRAALLEARELFDELMGAGHSDANRHHAAAGSTPTRADAAAHADDGRTRTDH
ncbi:hypothetical protein [Streptomyces sp. NPDC018610]|uniref:hypothetical protein n=1 Tax=Streptomyces sp. NPDC018610 TaxID=3365049 RepID=UPI0037958F2D